MFADDTKCYNVIHSPSDVANLLGDLDRISNWATLNKLSFQPVKCLNLRISRKRVSFDRTYSLNNVNLKIVSSVCDLGVHVAKDLLLSVHIHTIIAKANKVLGFLRRNCSRNLPHDVQRTLYIGLVRSHLTYASQIWAPSSFGSISLMRNLERVQRRATRSILRGLDLDYRSRLLHLRLLPLSFFLEYLDLLFFFRCLHGEILLDISQFVQFSSSCTRRGSSRLDLCLLPARTSTFRDSYFVRICPLQNSLPIFIRSSHSTSAFKSQLKTFLFFVFSILMPRMMSGLGI